MLLQRRSDSAINSVALSRHRQACRLCSTTGGKPWNGKVTRLPWWTCPAGCQHLKSWCKHVEVTRALTWEILRAGHAWTCSVHSWTCIQSACSLMIKIMFIYGTKRLKVCASAQLPETLYVCQAGCFLRSLDAALQELDVQRNTIQYYWVSLYIHSCFKWCLKTV